MTEDSDTTAECAAGCGHPVDLGQEHLTITQNVERLHRNTVTVFESSPLAYLHLHCRFTAAVAAEARAATVG